MTLSTIDRNFIFAFAFSSRPCLWRVHRTLSLSLSLSLPLFYLLSKTDRYIRIIGHYRVAARRKCLCFAFYFQSKFYFHELWCSIYRTLMDLWPLLSGHFINPPCRRADFKITRIVSSLLLLLCFLFLFHHCHDKWKIRIYRTEGPSNLTQTFSILPATQRLRERPLEKIRETERGGKKKRVTGVY